MDDEDSCSNCRFSLPKQLDENSGHVALRCHRFPPHGTIWAMVWEDDWCGEHQREGMGKLPKTHRTSA